MVRHLVRFAVYVARVGGEVIAAHLPLCVWLDNSTMSKYRTRL